MGLTITVLGCSGSYAGPGGACTGLLVESAGAFVWLDTGPGTAGRLQEHVSLDDLTAIVLTHEHPDHWLELPTIFNAYKWYLFRTEVPVFGTAGTKRLADINCGGTVDEVFDWTVIADGSTFTIGDQSWTMSQTDHTVETLAPRVDCDGRSFAFTADTADGWDLSALGDGIDLAISEATHLEIADDTYSPHMTARQAGAGAAAARVERLVLSHLMPGSDPEPYAREAGEAFGQPVTIAVPGDRYSV